MSTVDPTPLFPFGHGLSYTCFAWAARRAAPERVADRRDRARSSVTVRNTGDRRGAEVVQLYLHDPVAQVTRPVLRLIGYAAGRARAGRGAHGRLRGARRPDLVHRARGGGVVEPGDLELRLGASSADIRFTLPFSLTGARRDVGFDRVLVPEVR